MQENYHYLEATGALHYNMTNDYMFRMVLQRDKSTLINLISAVLDIPISEIQDAKIQNPVEVGRTISDKEYQMDILVLMNDNTYINIEMQVNREAAYKERTLFYWAKLYSEDLESGADYSELSQTICVNIINFNLFDCDNYHSHFLLKEKERDEVMTDKLAIHFFELKKVGKFKKNKRMEDWLTLINAETEGDLMALQQSTSIPEIQKTIVILREMSADEQIREEARRREKRLHDEATALNFAKKEGRAEGRAEGETAAFTTVIETMRKNGFTEEQIKLALGENYTG